MLSTSHYQLFPTRQLISFQNSPLMVKGTHLQYTIFLIFFFKCLIHKITDSNVTCRLLALTFRGRVKIWFESFRANSIHSLSKFVFELLSDFSNYYYDELSEELSCLRKENGELFNDFAIRLIHVCTRFPLKEMSFSMIGLSILFLSQTSKIN
jgi:hypothetical protein